MKHLGKFLRLRTLRAGVIALSLVALLGLQFAGSQHIHLPAEDWASCDLCVHSSDSPATFAMPLPPVLGAEAFTLAFQLAQIALSVQLPFNPRAPPALT